MKFPWLYFQQFYATQTTESAEINKGSILKNLCLVISCKMQKRRKK